jgi:putative MFS transporter
VSEFSPARHRGRLVVLLESFWALGWAAATIIAYMLAAWAEARGSIFPWRFAFFIGALPAFYVLVLRRSLPDSPRHLVARGRTEEAEATLRSVEAAAGVAPMPGDRLEPEPDTGQAARVRDLFGKGLLRRTTMLWILWFTMAYSFYGIFIWLPTLLLDQGLPMVRSFGFTMIITLAQIPGYFTAAYLVERIGRKATLVPFMLLCAAASYFFGGARTPSELILWGCLVSFFNLGAWGVTYGYTPELYPTRLRGTGAGAASAFGRLGAILAPLVVGAILESASGGLPIIFTMFAGVLVTGAVGVVLLGETGGRVSRVAGAPPDPARPRSDPRPPRTARQPPTRGSLRSDRGHERQGIGLRLPRFHPPGSGSRRRTVRFAAPCDLRGAHPRRGGADPGP